MALDAARGQWRALTGAGCKAQYWSEESGRWEKKAESGLWQKTLFANYYAHLCSTGAFETALAKPNPTLISIRGLAKLHAAAKRFDDAFKVLDTALTKDKRTPKFWLGLADNYRDTGLAARTFVGTPFGPREVSRLRIGDLVQTRDGGQEPVLHVAQRIVPGLGSFAPIRLRAPYFGLERDIVVAPHQKIFVSGAAVDYTFGCEGVLVPAGYLVNGQSALPEPNLPLVNYAQALLPSHAVFAASGAWTESLYVGRLRRDSEKLAATLLAGVRPTLLPEQAHLTPPVLKRFEAQALAEVA